MATPTDLKVICAWASDDFLASLHGSFAGEVRALLSPGRAA